jgi:chemotaxis signal transduction protein
MKEHSYLTFSLNNYLYGISLVYVEEIFSLPELTLIPQEPREIVGVVNLRGNIVPVMDLNFSFGYQSLDYRLTDSLVVLKWEQFRLGIIVNQVYEVKNISPEEITTQLDYERELAVVEQEAREQGALSRGDGTEKRIRPHLNENHLIEVGDWDPCSPCNFHGKGKRSFPPARKAPFPLPLR